MNKTIKHIERKSTSKRKKLIKTKKWVRNQFGLNKSNNEKRTEPWWKRHIDNNIMQNALISKEMKTDLLSIGKTECSKQTKRSYIKN